jgi:hypothetical protein
VSRRPNQAQLVLCASLLLAGCGSTDTPAPAVATATGAVAAAVPRANCGPGSNPESGTQGRLSRADIDSGLALRGITCNTELVGSYTTPQSYATVGGWKTWRYVDQNGHECAFYDASNIFPLGVLDDAIGTNVMDMSDPSHPVRTAQLTSPAMATPHESLMLSENRGLLLAVQSNPAVGPGVIDIYDVSQDCRSPTLKSITPFGTFGHESGISPDGNTFYSGVPFTPTLTAVDITNPELPLPIWTNGTFSHGISVSADGNRAYLADTTGNGRLVILDTSQIQARVPNPQVPVVATLAWDNGSIPQNTAPFTVKGKPFLLEFDEFGAQSKVGAARIIDLADEQHPKVISDLRLEVHQPEHFAEQATDPGADSTAYGGYAAHYCAIPTQTDPAIVACSMILSGLRVFDITDPYHPKETAYFNAPLDGGGFNSDAGFGGAVSKPTFAPERKEIWYSDSNSGFFAVRVTNGAWPDPR